MILDDIVIKQKERIAKEKKEKNIESLKREVLNISLGEKFFF